MSIKVVIADYLKLYFIYIEINFCNLSSWILYQLGASDFGFAPGPKKHRAGPGVEVPQIQ